MKRHVLLTGEIGAGKSTALHKTLELLQGVPVHGLQTYYAEAREAQNRQLYLRAWGSAQPGVFLTQLPGTDYAAMTKVYDTEGCALLEDARRQSGVIVIDEIGRLERDARTYHRALLTCLDGDMPVLAVIRKHKADWANWVRQHPKATLLEVTEDNRDGIPAQAYALLMGKGCDTMEDGYGHLDA